MEFAIDNDNKFKASLQHEGFVRSMTAEQELTIYHIA